MSCLVQHPVASMDALNHLESPACYNLERCKILEIASTLPATGALTS